MTTSSTAAGRRVLWEDLDKAVEEKNQDGVVSALQAIQKTSFQEERAEFFTKALKRAIYVYKPDRVLFILPYAKDAVKREVIEDILRAELNREVDYEKGDEREMLRGSMVKTICNFLR